MAQPHIRTQVSRLAKDLPLRPPSSHLPTRTIPKLIYGTAWKKDKTADLVYKALKNGFHAIDTAAQPKHYDEQAVGTGVKRAIAEGIIKREDLFIQTKFTAPAGQNKITPYDIEAPLVDKVHQSVQSSLANFTIDGEQPYLDSVVMHAPLDDFGDTLTVWRTLETYTPDKIRHLGISNIVLTTLQELHENVVIKPSVVQNRFHDQTEYEVALRLWCRERGIVFQSFWTLSANQALARSEPVLIVSQLAAVGIVAAYYSLVLGLEGIAVLDGTTNGIHMAEDLDGIKRVGTWAEGEGASEWSCALENFQRLIKEDKYRFDN